MYPTNIVGTPYKDLKNVACRECGRDAKLLGKVQKFLSRCCYTPCSSFICPFCVEIHSNVHELAGDRHIVEVFDTAMRRYQK